MKISFEKKHISIAVLSFLTIAACVAFYLVISHFPKLVSVLKTLAGILTPFILGFVFAYILNPVMMALERLLRRSVFKRRADSRAIRPICVAVSVLLLLAILFALVMMVIPTMLDSIGAILLQIPSALNKAEQWVNAFLKTDSWVARQVVSGLEKAGDNITQYAENLIPQVSTLLVSLAAGVRFFINFIIDFAVGIILSIYLLLDKEHLLVQAKKLTYAIFPKRFSNGLIRVGNDANRIFGGFIYGKIIDSLIIGLLCFLLMRLFHFPFPVLISVIVGAFNIIPFFGPFIGAIPSAFFILLESPAKAVWFVVMIIILQQIDGNIIGPRIVGESIGLSPIWVIFSILVVGGIFGIPGMFVGVPAFAVIYNLIRSFVDARLEQKHLPTDNASYASGAYPDKTPLPQPDKESPPPSEPPAAPSA